MYASIPSLSFKLDVTMTKQNLQSSAEMYGKVLVDNRYSERMSFLKNSTNSKHFTLISPWTQLTSKSRLNTNLRTYDIGPLVTCVVNNYLITTTIDVRFN